MAPKKNANVSIAAKPPDAKDGNPVKVTKKRPAVPRVTKAKPLKTPSVVTIKIQKPRKKATEVQETIGETVKADKPIKYEKHLKPDHLIELANQVAQFQLGKPKASPQQEAVPEEIAPEPTMKKGRPKKSKKIENKPMDSDVAPPAPKSKKKMPAKPKTAKAPPKPRVRKPKATETKKSKPEYVKPIPPKTRPKPKSKKKLDTSSQDVLLCPTILDELRSFEVTTTPMSSSRTNSIRSSSETSVPTDNFSWVKEISSSSTTTPTKDLVCINGKLPEIKLVDYRKSTRRQCKRKLDDIDSISGSSKTSGSSTKIRKVAKKNTFIMSQRKFRLSLRKKNNSWTVNNRQNGTRSPIRTQSNSTVANNNVKTSSSSSEICATSNVDLSSSSTSGTSHSTNITTNSVQNKTNIQTQDIRQKLDSLDLEFINWLGEVDRDLNLNKLSRISSDILRLEHEAIKESQHFKLRLSNSSSERSSERNATKTNSEALADDLPDIAQSISNNLVNSNDKAASNPNARKSNENDANALNKEAISAKPLPPTESTDNLRRKSCGETNYNNDDEDALSIFAESITGIESSKFSTVGSYKPARSPHCSPTSDDNEPKGPDFTEEYSYFKFSSGSDNSSPKVIESPETVTQKEVRRDAFTSSIPKFTERPKLVTCVKKIADSTSVQRDDNITAQNNAYVPKVDDSLQNNTQCKSDLMLASYFATPQVKSQVFRGVCFFNLISKCKCKNKCTFPHQRIPNEEIENRLQRLHENNFICEYLLVRKYPQLRQNYITTFVDECFRRDLTPILLEMVMDCYREEADIRTHAIETALLNISNKNLSDFEFFLHLNHELVGQKLVDVFMMAIADTQNFTRFKQVFVKLTEFMVHIRRKFVLDVAERILERICILPYEESLASAIIKIVQHTSVDILKHPSMNTFETRLRELNMDIFKKLEEYKKSVRLEPISPKVVNASTKLLESVNGHVPGLDKPKEAENRRYTSPDTTHFDASQIIPSNMIIPPYRNISPKMNVPSKMNVSPTKMNVPPPKMNVPPPKMNVQPPKMNVPPHKMNVPPRIMVQSEMDQNAKPKFEFMTLPRITRTIDISNSNNAKTYIIQPPQTITSPVEAVHQRAPKPLIPPFREPLLRPSYLNASFNVKAGQSYKRELGNTKFSLLSKRFPGRDAPFW